MKIWCHHCNFSMEKCKKNVIFPWKNYSDHFVHGEPQGCIVYKRDVQPAAGEKIFNQMLHQLEFMQCL